MSYRQTGSFSEIVTAYLEGDAGLRPFFEEPPTMEGIRNTIEKKKMQPVPRQLLADILMHQYAGKEASDGVMQNIEKLRLENTFTVTTAHQPNLFTGPLYFMYKIVHAIRLAQELKRNLPEYEFVPVYYMGSEDADFAELNHTWIDGKKIEWKKVQTGAVGRMEVDESLVQLIDELEGQLIGEVHGSEVIALLRHSYQSGRTIQSATFDLIHELYGRYGLVVLIPDDPKLKAVMHTTFEDDLFHGSPASIVTKTSEDLGRDFKVQAHPREINLFYLNGAIRERIVSSESGFEVLHTDIRFSAGELREELKNHPERFSPNVILRGLYQESILPNVAFVGGGGELAYWLQLKELFNHYHVVFPVLVLRNSFLIVEPKWRALIRKTGVELEELFQPVDALIRELIIRRNGSSVQLTQELEEAEALYASVSQRAGSVDPTLSRHVAALRSRSLRSLQELEKKLLRAEKRKWSAQEAQLQKLRNALFPNGGLQERVENFSLFYAKWGREFISELLRHSNALEQEFTCLVHAS